MADQKINGALYRSMVIEGALAIAEKKEQANELNVFPEYVHGDGFRNG